MRQGQSKQIGCLLINSSPNCAAGERHESEPGIRQMKTSKNGCNQGYAKPARTPDDLCPPIDEALEHILLHESPTKTQSQLAEDRPAGMPSQKIYFAAEPPTGEQAKRRDQKHREQ